MPRELRFVRTDDGIVVFLTLGLGGGGLARRRARAGERDRGARAPRRPGDRRRRGTHRAVSCGSACSIPLGPPAGARLGRPRRRRPRRPSRRADAAVVLHRAAARPASTPSIPLAEVRLLAPVLHPPSIRVFDDQTSFAFANPAAIVGTGLRRSPAAGRSCSLPRIAAVHRRRRRDRGLHRPRGVARPARRPPKDRDFALGLGPVVVTTDALEPGACVQVVRVDGAEVRTGLPVAVFDWAAAPRSPPRARGSTRATSSPVPRPGTVDPLDARLEGRDRVRGRSERSAQTRLLR